MPASPQKSLILAIARHRELLPSARGSTRGRILIEAIATPVSSLGRGAVAVDVVHERCAGLDVHKQTVTGCVITPEVRETRTFGTMTAPLLELVAWLQHHGVTHVAMESTGVYWKPVYNLLEGSGIEVLVVNAQHIKQVPGRKTDVKDAAWIAELLRHGLLRGSFIPDRNQRELRELVRYRRSLIQEQAREANRIQKVLEGANIKLGCLRPADVKGHHCRRDGSGEAGGFGPGSFAEQAGELGPSADGFDRPAPTAVAGCTAGPRRVPG